jgi:hypothetical protein
VCGRSEVEGHAAGLGFDLAAAVLAVEPAAYRRAQTAVRLIHAGLGLALRVLEAFGRTGKLGN